MPRAFWRLKYDRSVTAKLYELRERGSDVHSAIKALAFQAEPWTGSLVTGDQSGWYELRSTAALLDSRRRRIPKMPESLR